MSLSTGGAALSIAGGVREFARATPGVTAVIDGDRTLSYAALDERASRLANALLVAGLRPGERIGVLLGNRLEYPEVACGIAKAGLVMVPIGPRSTSAEAAYILAHSTSRALILDGAHTHVVGDVLGDLDIASQRIWSIDTAELGTDYERALATARPADPRVPVDELDPFSIVYTSGTTGKPKGVQISHRSRTLTFYCAALEWRLGAGRRSIAVAPMYHGAGFAFGYAPVCTGGTVSMLRKWDPERLLRMVETERAQSAFLVPTHAHTIRALGERALSQRDLGSLDTMYFNAAALPGALKEWVMASFPGAGVHELYGSTEAGIVTDCRPSDAARKIGSVGQPWYLTEIRLLDERGDPVPPGSPGELFSRSPFLMNGYLDDAAATEACTTTDGFLSSGDIAIADEEGFISIVDRKKDMIISGGVNVYPREVEEVVVAFPGISEVAVVGMPSAEWGEQVTAFIASLPGHDVDVPELEAFCRARLSGPKLPRWFEVVPELPRNAAGKILKRDLRASERAASPDHTSPVI